MSSNVTSLVICAAPMCGVTTNRIALIGRQSRSLNGNGAGRHNSEAYCFAVKKFLIIASALDRVTNRMSEIKNRSFAGAITLVFRNDLRFYLDVAPDQG